MSDTRLLYDTYHERNKIYDKSEEGVKVLSFNGKTAFFVELEVESNRV